MSKSLLLTCFLFLASSQAFGWENNMDLPGYDYRNFEVSSPSRCEQICDKEERCWAWTYVRPGVQGANARCWLKDRVPRPTRNSCCISGSFKPRDEGARIDPGSASNPVRE